MLNDTSLATRRALLRSNRETWAASSRSVVLGRETREIVTENRITLRSPVTMSLSSDVTLTGIVDLSMPRRGQAEFWVVMYTAQRWKAEDQAGVERMLDSFRVTGAPTSVSVAQP